MKTVSSLNKQGLLIAAICLVQAVFSVGCRNSVDPVGEAFLIENVVFDLPGTIPASIRATYTTSDSAKCTLKIAWRNTDADFADVVAAMEIGYADAAAHTSPHAHTIIDLPDIVMPPPPAHWPLQWSFIVQIYCISDDGCPAVMPGLNRYYLIYLPDGEGNGGGYGGILDSEGNLL